MANKEFYTYVHKRKTDGKVFYVGKGSAGRAWDFVRRNWHWKCIVAKHGVDVEIDIGGLQEWAAFEREFQLIALHGRKDCGYGILVNYSDGGSGATGTIFTKEQRERVSLRMMGESNVSKRADVRLKLSKAMLTESNPMRNKIISAKVAAANTGKTASVETKKKMSDSHLGKVFSESTRQKISAQRTGKRHSAEACLKMTESQKKRWADRKSAQM